MFIARGNIQKGSIAASFGGASSATSGSFSFYVGPGGADVVMSVGFGGLIHVGGGKDAYSMPVTGTITFPRGGSLLNTTVGMFTALNLTPGWHSISYSMSGGSADASASWSATVLYR
jgi:hypothetical protein